MAKEKKAPSKSGAKKSGAKKAAAKTRAPSTKVAKKVEVQGTSKATLRNVRISPRKCRLIVNLIKGKQVEPALQILQFSPNKAAVFTRKLLKSAIANATEHAKADVDRLWITDAWVHMGKTMQRGMPGAHGRMNPVRKRSSHITIILSER